MDLSIVTNAILSHDVTMQFDSSDRKHRKQPSESQDFS